MGLVIHSLQRCAQALILSIFAVGVMAQDAIVDGSDPDGDGDNRFTTLQAAVDYVIGQGQTMVEVQTEGPLSGFDVLGASVDGLTIRAGEGFRPLVTTGIRLLSTQPLNHITVEGFDLIISDVNKYFDVTGNITIKNCKVEDQSDYANDFAVYAENGPGGEYGVVTPDTTLILDGCDFKADNGCDVYTVPKVIIRNSTIETLGVSCLSTYAYAGHFATVELEGSVFKGGDSNLILHPMSGPDAAQMNTAISAVNCIFIGGPDTWGGDYRAVIKTACPAAQSFKHCTFRSRPGQQKGVVFQIQIACPFELYNCLFDYPVAQAAIGVEVLDHANMQASGDNNLYNLNSGEPVLAYYELTTGVKPPFEANNTFAQEGSAADVFVSDANGRLTIDSVSALQRALVLNPPVITDIDGNGRPSPAGTLPDIGASEEMTVPVELSSFRID